VSKNGGDMFYFITIINYSRMSPLLSTRQQLPNFYPLLTHDRDLQEREGQERDGESVFICNVCYYTCDVSVGFCVNVSVIFC
jgi:hypothetical protein